MERSASVKDVAYPPPQGPESPLAPIVSTPPDWRAGGSTFSPSQTLDHHPRPPHVVKRPPQDPTPNDGARYKECLKNHAASMGGHVVDGCGEFMPNGEEGTAEALRCAACDCHRNFHRKEVDGEAYRMNPSRTPLLRSRTLAADQQHRHHQVFGAAAPAMVSFGDVSSSEDLNMVQPKRKRFRTKFSEKQKEQMQELAERLGWRIQKQDEDQVQRLCNETGLNRQVFKVWMHNNKQSMKKRQIN